MSISDWMTQEQPTLSNYFIISYQKFNYFSIDGKYITKKDI